MTSVRPSIAQPASVRRLRAGGLGVRLAVIIVASLLLGPNAAAQDGGERQVYLRVGIGESNPLTKANDVGNVAIGANLRRYFGVELALDRYELTLRQGSVRAGETSQLNFVPAARFRYPLLSDRLVPYLSLGVGAVTTQINDTSTDVNWSGGGTTRARAVGSFGGGLEYYFSDDVAFGVEGKYFLTGQQTFSARGERTSIDLSAGIVTWGLRVLYPETPNPGSQALVESRAARRFFVSARYGVALPMRSHPFPGVEAHPEQPVLGSNFTPLYVIALGVRLAPWLDLELSGSNYVLDLRYPGGTSEYAVFPVVLTPKVHVPTSSERLDPYLLAGVGAEFVEVSDRPPVPVDGTGHSVIGVFGAGLDYFVTSNVAFGLETRYTISRGHTLTVGDAPPQSGNLDSLFVSLGVRAFFLDL
ncbi:outer membrane beta-barrel protein [Candidatus Binatia bacterium]|jgi:opacity protein-like surface antigen|nr:outer membrane beta-barrel protein [Candidatus Binatia bacterium]